MSDPMQPQGIPSSAAPKKKSPWPWILGGCAAIVVIGTIITSVALWWGYHKAKNYVNKELDGALGNMNTVSQLWTDVPAIEGFTPSQEDMPATVKLLARTILGNLGRLNKEGEDRSTGEVDWIVFSGNNPPDAIKEFYTPDRMTENGWEKTDKSCMSGSEQGFPQVGSFCVFQKMQDGKITTQLAIIGWESSDSKKTSLFYLRLTPDNPK